MAKYKHVKDEWIREALEEYKDKIDENKSHRLDISSYRVEKPWGHELWLELNEHYAYKLIHMNNPIVQSSAPRNQGIFSKPRIGF